MVESQEVLADLNIEQLNKGLRSDGTVMPDYSQVSVEFYGKPDGPIKLKDTGAFYQGAYVRVTGDQVKFSSTDQKTEMLTERYRESIFGLNDQYKGEAIREVIQPTLNKKIEAATGLKMGV